jgi:3-oxoadipate enol-lactonase
MPETAVDWTVRDGRARNGPADDGTAPDDTSGEGTAHDGVSIYYELAGPADAPVVAFVTDVGYGPWLWGWQAPALTGPWRTLVWDLPGAGRSDDPPPGCDVALLTDALEAVLRAAEVRRVHLVGAGLGGMVALAYATDYGRARSLTLLDTANSGDAVDGTALRDLALEPDAQASDAPAASCEESLAGALTVEFRAARPDLLERICDWRASEDARGEAFVAHAEAALGFEGVNLPEVTLPALVCHGADDPVVPVGVGRDLAADLPRGRFEAVLGRHCPYVEHSRAVTDRLEAFLDEVAGGD